MRIAIYGKGGIGKSTTASNISSILGDKGKRVLQVGCDPKHDSTLLLTEKSDSTLLEMAATGKALTADMIIKKGKYGVDCIEIGGPQPGVGCAGRGILKGMEILKQLKICSDEYDLIIYDILGDVVCGGFFAPLTSGNLVDELYIVTSGEFNSLYAANNIVNGYLNCKLDKKGVRLAGVIGNMRGLDNEEKIITHFCETLQLPLVATIPRSADIECSTIHGVPLITDNNSSEVLSYYQRIAMYMLQDHQNHIPRSFSLPELRNLYIKTLNM